MAQNRSPLLPAQPELSSTSSVCKSDSTWIWGLTAALTTLAGAFLALTPPGFWNKLMAVPCTGCHYCLPCPQGVAIPDVLGVYNEVKMFGDLDRASPNYGWIDEKARGCVENYPQGIDILEWMKKMDEELGQPEKARVVV